MPYLGDSFSSTNPYSASEKPEISMSIFGAFKQKLGRKSSSSRKSKQASQSNMTTPGSNNPFSSPAVKPAHRESLPYTIVTPPSQTKSANKPSAPDHAPPAYSVTPPSPSENGYLGSNGGPVRSPSPAPSNAGSIMSSTGMSVSTPEDPYAFLSSFDTIFVIDDSGSMSGRSWPEVQGVIRNIAPICTSHDEDGVDLYFLNHKTQAGGNPREGKAAGGYYGIRRADTVEGIFTSVRPRGCTPTGQRLLAILKPYLQLLETKKNDIESVKPINLIVITDGAPSDDVEATILYAAKKLDKLDAPMHQVGVQFFQVGNEPGAREALRELDDDLVGRCDGDLRDMVDTVTWENGTRGVLTADNILKVVLGAVVRRLDRRRTSGESRR
ncbi:uncharacterized protein CLUP02_01011 [Colletotrichum lupini]|uniref:VWFA domain-containing protein n=2 Tax=Colletotrichum acutatum species complex TaxID=2707335 RepID=A0A9Q8W869_9PEZI|nr:uncharacterized protein CLUP02_01011 [Colletotrichum lupini]KAK0376455.1 hypothetical protein CLIM01_06188 [Colletotrichum limetticola]UQC74363.1 hypothetical protein CLUP02_01011 [Colletotrichum lupini]